MSLKKGVLLAQEDLIIIIMFRNRLMSAVGAHLVVTAWVKNTVTHTSGL